jgi:hypothetical protein
MHWALAVVALTLLGFAAISGRRVSESHGAN